MEVRSLRCKTSRSSSRCCAPGSPCNPRRRSWPRCSGSWTSSAPNGSASPGSGCASGGDAVLYLTHDLLGEYLRLEENNKRRAVKEKLGRGDQLSGFLQWVGTYCGYISFLTAEYIKLRSNVYRIAALLLGIKEACAIGTGLREYVEALLGRLRQEKSRNT